MKKDTSEIARLTERISQDPTSKLFVALAEEHKKNGNLDLAVRVLTEGLKHNPGYATAKSLLGRLLLEKGDAAGAQKEFEEVVRAAPDNLLAQRKLGDLLALRNNPSEALKHYKLVLAQNPGDEAFAALVSDLESGLDVRPRIQQQMKPSPEPVSTPEISPASPQQAQPAAPLSSMPEPGKPPEPLPGITDFSQPETQLEHEEPEEVLVVEPLEDELPAESSGFDFLDGGIEEIAPVADEFAGELSVAQEPLPGELETAGEPEQASAVSAFGEAAPLEAISEAQEPETAAGPTVDQSDDFTTDTLAELYIAQGFFEKAIDIYQRMLADHPESRGLRDKLQRVKAMADATEVAAEQEGATEAIPADTAEAREYVPPAAVEQEEELTIEAELLTEPEETPTGVGPAGGEETSIFAEPAGYRRAGEPEEASLAAGPEEAYGAVEQPASRAFTGTRPVSADFEPREYIPPGAELRAGKKAEAHTAPKQPAAGRKETIDRLETWLKNIAKEK